MTHRARTADSRDDFETPPEVFDKLSARAGGFDLDVFASHENHLCPLYMAGTGSADPFLQTPWHEGWYHESEPDYVPPRNAFANPPYLRAAEALQKASEQRIEVYSLVPSAPATAHWFQNVWGLADDEHGASEVWFVKGRINFLIDGKRPTDEEGRETSGNHDSAIVIHRPWRRGPPLVAVWDWKADRLTYMRGNR